MIPALGFYQKGLIPGPDFDVTIAGYLSSFLDIGLK
jgi:hypothetical protein